MSVIIKFEDLGVSDYQTVWDYQERLFNELISQKSLQRSHSEPFMTDSGHLLFVEHPHVYTLGKSGVENNLLVDDDFLKSIKASFFRIDRGGDITYHGPGQIVGYPIFDLEQMGLGLKSYIFNLEEVIIRTVADFGIDGKRLDGAAGVWLDVDKPGHTRKICAIGVRASRFVSMHGFALNVNTDLKYFNFINPCGFVDKGVTSIQKELGFDVDVSNVKESLRRHFQEVFHILWK
ncbi:lipoyl(octanoyl) transferase [Breznakibacter xylanolyticus]|uniref:Octanoyltransferase n=1 Tax=Breznakibacter xylanolyticus TaxID=990 RepID=A0A2W7NTP4_9BACT|nr:lipoyl(octanoyl) transferase LipB [Breznakibacter xylanolyticus]PZX16706.1 lipoyl(octanoyl) transferase [Breznakibacter xylanolyticus]